VHLVEEIKAIVVDDAEDVSEVESHHIFLPLLTALLPVDRLNKARNL
jgi:hypothetical protein